MSNNKILIAYFSHSGHTMAVAKKIQSVVGGDLFEIEPVNPYIGDYNELVEQGKYEKQHNIFPELKDDGDVSDYDTIYVGTPVWWYTMAPPVKTFLANNNFAGKTIKPFCTHGGGGASETYTDMQKLAPDATVSEGFTSYEDTATLDDIKAWA